jgi:S-adenosylmethionine synthetase
MVAAGLCEEVLVQVSYAIGVAQPCGFYISTYGTSKVDMPDGVIAEKISQLFDMRPYAIETRLNLRQPMYSETAAYGHMGRINEVIEKRFTNTEGKEVVHQVELFTWEKLDMVSAIKSAFDLA